MIHLLIIKCTDPALSELFYSYMYFDCLHVHTGNFRKYVVSFYLLKNMLVIFFLNGICLIVSFPSISESYKLICCELSQQNIILGDIIIIERTFLLYRPFNTHPTRVSDFARNTSEIAEKAPGACPLKIIRRS